MSTNDPASETSGHCGDDAAAYVLGALEPAEAETFRRHLSSCAICRDEVAAFQQVADVLPMTAPRYKVSRSLRRRVLREVRAEPRLGAADSRRRRRSAFLPRLALPRPALSLAALLAAVVVTVGAVELGSGGSSGVRVIQASVVGEAGSAQLRVGGGHAELIVRHLPPPPAGRIYEVWLRHGQRSLSPTSALFSVTSTGAGDVEVPGDLHGVSAVMVTPEPAGGSVVPTHAPVIIAQLT